MCWRPLLFLIAIIFATTWHDNTNNLMITALTLPASMTKNKKSLEKSILYHNVAQHDDENEETVAPLEIAAKRYGSFSSLASLVGGGDGASEDDNITTFTTATTAITERKRVIMAIALFSTYLSVMGAKCALPSTLNIITSSNSGLHCANGEPQKLMSTVLTISTGAISLGKFLLGPVIDKYGGRSCLKIALTALMGALGLIASTNSFRVFAVSWIMVDFIFSSCWAACLNAIHDTFSEEDWPNRIGSLAVAGRVGNALSFFTFASILNWAQNRSVVTTVDTSWRMVFWASSLMQVVPLAMLRWFDEASPAPFPDCQEVGDGTVQNGSEPTQRMGGSSTTSINDSIRLLKEEMKKLQFWMHLISRSCLMVVASFLLFVPSYMTNAYGMTNASAARVGSLYAIGSLLSVSIGAKRFSTSRTRTKLLATCLQLGTLFLCCLLQMAHVLGIFPLSYIGGALSMFIWGLTFSIPFYIPPSMYALRRGGRESSATIADAFDLVGFMMLAWFNGFVASRQQDLLTSWVPTFTILAICSLSSLFSLSVALTVDV